MEDKKTCILCNKTIKKFAKWNDNKQRQVHRKCWLNFRDFGDRHFDYLFAGDRKKKQAGGKTIIITPLKEEEHHSHLPTLLEQPTTQEEVSLPKKITE